MGGVRGREGVEGVVKKFRVETINSIYLRFRGVTKVKKNNKTTI